MYFLYYHICSDRADDGGTFQFSAYTGEDVYKRQGDVTVKNVIPKHLEAISAKLLEIGCEVEEFDDAVRVVSSKPLHHTVKNCRIIYRRIISIC